jgi:hypothetical protein
LRGTMNSIEKFSRVNLWTPDCMTTET